MSDPLSVTASSLAVLGAADILLRTIKEIHGFLSEIKDVPSELARLRDCVCENELLVEEVKRYNDELQISVQSSKPFTSPTTAACTAIPLFDSALKSLQRDSTSLADTLRKYTKDRKSWNNLKFVLAKKDINKRLQQFETAKSTLVNALGLIDRQRNVISHETTVRDIKRSISSLALKNHNQHDSLSQRVNVVQKMISDVQSFQQRDAISKENQIASGTADIIQIITSKFDELSGSLASTHMSVKVSNRKIRFNGPNLRSGLSALLRLDSELPLLISHISQCHNQVGFAKQLNWLHDEFEALLESMLQETAASSHRSTAKSFDMWMLPPEEWCPSQGFTDRRRSGMKRAFITENDSGGRSSAERLLEGAARQILHGANRKVLTFSQSTSSVSVSLTNSNKVSRCSPGSSESDEAGLLFCSSDGNASIVLDVRFRSSCNSFDTPQLCAQLNIFHLFDLSGDDDYTYNDLLANGTLEEIDRALRCGVISPYAMYRCGYVSCLYLAACFMRDDVLAYLDRQGIGMRSFNNTYGVITGIRVSATDEMVDGSRMLACISYVEGCNFELDVTNSEDALSADAWNSSPVYEEHRIRGSREWISTCQKAGYDLERPQRDGLTPLFDWLRREGGQSLEMARLLLEAGADVLTVIADKDLDALECAMMSSYRERYRDILVQKFYILIKAGADVHRCGRCNYSLSHKAKYHYSCWPEWLEALGLCGFDVADFIEACDDIDDDEFEGDWETDDTDNESEYLA